MKRVFPERVKVKGQQLPASFADVLRLMYESADPRLDATLLAANRDGWTLQALAQPLGVTRERIRQRVGATDPLAYPSSELPALPMPPMKLNPIPTPRRRLLVGDELGQRLRAMHAVARTVTGGTPVDSPKRRTSEDLTDLLAALIAQGVSAYTLAQVMDVNINTVQFRLARHGHRPLPASMAGLTYRNEQVAQIQPRDECKRGHPLSGDNVGMPPSGGRYCKTCQRRRGQESYRRRKARRSEVAA